MQYDIKIVSIPKSYTYKKAEPTQYDKIRMQISGKTGLDKPLNVSSHKKPITVQEHDITILPKNIKNADMVPDMAICAP